MLPGMPLSRVDQCVLAVRDILDQDPLLRTLFGGRTLAGTASITPGTTTLTGVGTSWATGDDSLSKGDRLVLGDQVAWLSEDPTNTTAEIRTPHADGLVGAEIHKAARAKRVQDASQVTSRAMPYMTVGAAAFVDIEPTVGRLVSNPAVTVSYVYDVGHDELADDESSWSGLLQHTIQVVKEFAGGNLCVPRFHTAAGGVAALTRRFAGGVPNFSEIDFADGTGAINPSVVLNFEGGDPLESVNLVQRW